MSLFVGRGMCKPATPVCTAALYKSHQLRFRTAVVRNASPGAQQQPGKLDSFDPPGFLDDLAPENKPGWSATISEYCDNAREGDKTDVFDSPRPQFFNATKMAVGADMVTKAIAWRAFPNSITQRFPADVDRWSRADASRDRQDEYCEWSVEKNAAGKITRVMFTCEGPEYWTYLSKKQPETVLQLYQQHVNPAVKMEDLFINGKYEPRNKWNRDSKNGAMHLIMGANTLNAEIELAGGSSIVRLGPDGEYLQDDQDLIKCGQYGSPKRFSDPSIGSAVNALARQGWMVTLENPIALYFDSFKPVNFVTPDGTDAATFWTWTRGTPGRYLRGVFEVPASKGYLVGDIIIISKGNIRYGAMLADYIKMKLTGLACNKNKSNVKPVQGCVGDPAPATDSAAVGLNKSAATAARGTSRMLMD